MKVRINNEVISGKQRLKIRIRLDYGAEEKNGRFFFGSKTSQVMAEALRTEHMAKFKHVPSQGLVFENFDDSAEIFVVNIGDGARKREVAYAPLVLTVQAEQIEDLFPLMLRPEFRKIEILEPDALEIDKIALERLLHTFYQQFRFEITKNGYK